MSIDVFAIRAGIMSGVVDVLITRDDPSPHPIAGGDHGMADAHSSKPHGNTVHGHTWNGGGRTPTYRSWHAMVRRCTNPRDVGYADYGGRGIHVCEGWRKFENFLVDMGVRPDGHSIDRLDSNRNYEPGNCRWATPKEQAENKREPKRNHQRAKTHCPKGHPYDEANTRLNSRGHRTCRACYPRWAGTNL